MLSVAGGPLKKPYFSYIPDVDYPFVVVAVDERKSAFKILDRAWHIGRLRKQRSGRICPYRYSRLFVYLNLVEGVAVIDRTANGKTTGEEAGVKDSYRLLPLAAAGGIVIAILSF